MIPITKTNSIIYFLLSAVLISIFTKPTSSATDSFIYGGCSQLKFTPNSPTESYVNSALASLVNSAMTSNYNNFTVQTVSSLFQCRGDLTSTDCARCVARAVSQLGSLCLDSTGAVLQLDGCFIKYDNSSFLGVEDKTEVFKKCGPLISYDSAATLTNRDAVLSFLGSTDGAYRLTASGGLSAVAQCTGDLSVSECQDCLSEAIGRLKTDCGGATWGAVYLGKCYARYSEGGSHSPSHTTNGTNDNDEEIEKTLAILIGLIAGVCLLVIFLSCLSKCCEKAGKGGK